MDTPPTFGEWLRQRRRDLDLTQDALARQVGCARITIRKLEANDIRPSTQLAELIVDRLGVPVQDRAKFVHFGRSGSPTGLAPPPQHNLPNNPSSFVGREKELTAVKRLLNTSRLVTLTGAGGIGKTRLALRAANQLLNAYPDGVWWVELAPLVRPGSPKAPSSGPASQIAEDLVPQAVAKAVRILEVPGRSVLDGILEALREKKVLLVLDNCEHLIEDCAALAELLLGQCPEVSVLATSREALSVPGEKAWLLPSLSLPEAGSAVDASHIFQSEAVSLFIERAGDVQPGYQPQTAEALTIAQICLRLDGIPLAIELAAARMSLLSAQEIASRLDQRFSLLTRGRRTALPRHQTLRAAIEWSHDLLSAPEQTLFRRLSVFAGGFSLEAAEAICAGQGIEQDEVLALLGRLIDKSLLQVQHAPPDGALSTRYHYLDTIRSFGRLKLDEANETRWVRDGHADYYVRMAEAAEPDLLFQNQVLWFKRLLAEMGNMRAVIEWSSEKDEAESALRVVTALFWFWWLNGYSREGRDLTLKALALPSAMQLKERRAAALSTAGFDEFLQGDIGTAKRMLEEAVPVLRPSNDEVHLAWALQFFGLVLAYEKEYALADKANQEGVAIARRLSNAYTSSLLFFLGDVDLLKGDIVRAKKTYEENAARLRELQSKSALAYPLRRLGYLALDQGDLPNARRYFQESLELNHEIGDLPGTTASLASAAALAIRLDQPATAARLCGAIENQWKTLGVYALYTDQAQFARIRGKLRGSLAEGTFNTAFSEGWDLSLEQAIALAEELLRGIAAGER
jgi:predicted ATPase/DNA-binding XRE family transcriptional regulator